MNGRQWIAAVAAATALGCGTDPNPNIGSLSYDFTSTIAGLPSGSFNTSGVRAAGTDTAVLAHTSWAAAAIVSFTTLSGIEAFKAGPATFTRVRMYLGQNVVGTYSLGCASGGFCNMIRVDYDVPYGGPVSSSCNLSSGSITYSEITATRAKGSFSGAGTCTKLGSSPANGTITIVNGIFDVAITTSFTPT